MFCEFAVCVIIGTIFLQFLMWLRPEDYYEDEQETRSESLRQ